MINEERSRLASGLKEDENKIRDISRQLEVLSGSEEAIREKELATLNLYLATRKMSESLTFGDIFSVFSVLLKENFSFKRSDLIILKWADSAPGIGNIYSVALEGTGESCGKKGDYDKLIERLSETPEAVYIEKDDGASIFAAASPRRAASQPTSWAPTGRSSGTVCNNSCVSRFSRSSPSAETISRKARRMP